MATAIAALINLYPQMRLVESPFSGRGLVASQPFQIGDLIFSELPLLHTSHPVARACTPSVRVHLPHDWQRLLHLHAHLRRTGTSAGSEGARLAAAVRELSTAGVTGALSRAADPEREGEYRTGAAEWVARWREGRKKREKAKRRKTREGAGEGGAEGPGAMDGAWEATVDDIERLVAVLETNSHSRDEDDQMDLSDPRADAGTTAPQLSPTKRALDTLSAPASDLSSDGGSPPKDEACGLWLIASMLNHSCIPNCTADIPSSRNHLPVSGGASASLDTPLPPLRIRCIRPIAPGDELTISYHDEEFLPTADRRALLRPRGFICACSLCSGAMRDYARAAVCPKCADGVCAPRVVDGQPEWTCDRCDARLSAAEREAVEEAEEAWMAHWEDIMDMVSSPDAPDAAFAPYRVLQALVSADIPPEAAPLSPEPAPPPLPPMPFLAPLHGTHGHVYAFLKYAVFEESVWLRARFGSAGVLRVLLAMAAIVARSLGEACTASEERRVVGFWLVKETERADGSAGGNGGLERWRQLGFRWWQEGMRDLYGRSVQD